MNKKDLEETIVGQLKLEFGGLDYWRLSKKWKEYRYNVVARRITTLVEANTIHENMKDDR